MWVEVSVDFQRQALIPNIVTSLGLDIKKKKLSYPHGREGEREKGYVESWCLKKIRKLEQVNRGGHVGTNDLETGTMNTK